MAVQEAVVAERRAFTNPVNIPAEWPFINTNPFDESHFTWYLRCCGDSTRAILIDTGVHTLFRDPRVRDYPPGFLARYNSFIQRVARLAERYASEAVLYYVVPDIPVDYPGRGYLYPWNVERTVEYARVYLKLSRGLPGEPIAVVQGRPDDPASTVRAYREYYDVYGEYSYVALGPTCTSRNVKGLARQLAAFDAVVHTRWHAFGVHTKALAYMASRGIPLCRLASVDSSSYWFDIAYRNGRGKSKDDMAEILVRRMRRIQGFLNTIKCKPRITQWR